MGRPFFSKKRRKMTVYPTISTSQSTTTRAVILRACEPEMPQPLGLGVVDRMQTRRRKSAASDKVDIDGQGLPGGIEIDAPHVPGPDNPKGRFKHLVLHIRPSASKAECRAVLHQPCSIVRSRRCRQGFASLSFAALDGAGGTIPRRLI